MPLPVGPDASHTKTPPSAGPPPTARSAHDMLIAIGIMSAFVYVMVIVAGTSRTAGRAIVALFIALVILQGLGRINPFAFFANHPLQKRQA